MKIRQQVVAGRGLMLDGLRAHNGFYFLKQPQFKCHSNDPCFVRMSCSCLTIRLQSVLLYDAKDPGG